MPAHLSVRMVLPSTQWHRGPLPLPAWIGPAREGSDGIQPSSMDALTRHRQPPARACHARHTRPSAPRYWLHPGRRSLLCGGGGRTNDGNGANGANDADPGGRACPAREEDRRGRRLVRRPRRDHRAGGLGHGPAKADGHEPCGGRFEFRDLPPGRYRLSVPGIDGRIVWSGEHLVLRGYHSEEFVLQEGRPLALRHRTGLGLRQRPTAGTPLTGRPMPMLTLVETCQTGRLPGVPSGREIWGAARLPDGQPAAGIPVHVERLREGRTLTADHVDVRTRTSATGCFGLAGLWPGRYRDLHRSRAVHRRDRGRPSRRRPSRDRTSRCRRRPRKPAPNDCGRPGIHASASSASTISELLEAVTDAEPALRPAARNGTTVPTTWCASAAP